MTRSIPTPATPPATQTRTRAQGVVLGLLLVLVLAWFLVIQRFGEGNVYAVLGPVGLLVVIVTSVLDRDVLRAWFTPTKRNVALGLVLGVGMTALTYPVFQLAAAVYPGLVDHVRGLYSGARSTTLARALSWVLTIILAEELLFRGALPRALATRVSPRNALVISWLLYTIAQCGTGSVIVTLMAAICGAIWGWQRRYTDSLISPLIAHLIWTPIVILLYPVA